MTVALGVMSVPAPVDGDSIRRYETGTLPDGGLWTALRRLSDHNHTGGVNGAPISVASIPPGSITVDKLDPAVLLPYALVDGSKPFTGQVAMNSDAIIRDHLYFGAKPAGVADATLARTGAGALRVDTHLGVGVNPAGWAGTYRSVQVGVGGSLYGTTNLDTVGLGSNMYSDGATNRAIAAGAAATLGVGSAGGLEFYTAPSVGAGAALAFTRRASIAPTGTLFLSPDAGAPALNAVIGGTVGLVMETGAATNMRLRSTNGSVEMAASNGYWHPNVDNAVNLGVGGARFIAVYAVAGAINTSSQEFKEGITPLSPERAMQAVRDTEAVTFDYVAPTRGPEWYDLPDDPEQAEAVLQHRLTAAPLEAAARHQAGFIAEAADPLFLVGEGQTSPGNSVGVLIAALQHIDARLTALEGA
jgi:hypothetical protein